MPTFLPDPRVGHFERHVAPSTGSGSIDTHRFTPLGTLVSTVEEHCQECAAPDCYAHCPLHVRDARVGCRRLPGGMGWGTRSAGDEAVHVEVGPLARLKFKADLGATPLWRHGFFLRFLPMSAPGSATVVIQLSTSPWAPEVPGITLSAPVQDGWNELYINPHDLSFLLGSRRVEASVLFNEYAGGIEITAAHFVEGLASPDLPESITSPRVLFTDLDGTLWTGVAGEGPIEARAGAREALERFRDARVAVVAVTRATKEDANDGIESQGLRGVIDQVIVVDPSFRKAEAIAGWLAHETRGVDEAIFADDDPAERWDARARLPGLQVLDERELCAGLLHPAIATRTGPSRRSDGAQHPNVGSALVVAGGSLRPRAELAVASVADHPRVWELLVRTNRFNCAAWRPDFGQFIDVVGRADVTVWRGTCADDLVEYGIVCGAVIEHPATIRALTFSCRIGHRRFPWLLLDQLRSALAPGEVTWPADPAGRADPLVDDMRSFLSAR